MTRTDPCAHAHHESTIGLLGYVLVAAPVVAGYGALIVSKLRARRKAKKVTK